MQGKDESKRIAADTSALISPVVGSKFEECLRELDLEAGFKDN